MIIINFTLCLLLFERVTIKYEGITCGFNFFLIIIIITSKCTFKLIKKNFSKLLILYNKRIKLH